MEAEEREKLLEQSNLLRQELKAWEREFAAANGGRKAEREDIKQNPTIGMEIEELGEPVNIYFQRKNTKIITVPVISSRAKPLLRRICLLKRQHRESESRRQRRHKLHLSDFRSLGHPLRVIYIQQQSILMILHQ